MEKCPICHTEHFPSSWLSRYNTNCPVMDLGQRGGHARPIDFSISSVPSALCRSDCMKCAHRETCFADLCVFVFITHGAYTYCVYLNVYMYIYTLFQKYLCARKHTAHARVDWWTSLFRMANRNGILPKQGLWAFGHSDDALGDKQTIRFLHRSQSFVQVLSEMDKRVEQNLSKIQWSTVQLSYHPLGPLGVKDKGGISTQNRLLSLFLTLWKHTLSG